MCGSIVDVDKMSLERGNWLLEKKTAVGLDLEWEITFEERAGSRVDVVERWF